MEVKVSFLTHSYSTACQKFLIKWLGRTVACQDLFAVKKKFNTKIYIKKSICNNLV